MATLTAIRITRPKRRWVDLLRGYKLLLDDVEMGVIRRGKVMTLPCAPGLRKVQARIDWTGSHPLMVRIKEGETFDLEVFPTRSAMEVGMTGGEFAADYLTLYPLDPNDVTRTSLVEPGPWG